ILAQARFRVEGRPVEIWRPMDGSIARLGENAGALMDETTGNRQPGIQPVILRRQEALTAVPLDLAPRESVFVVFRKHNEAPQPKVDHSETARELNGVWTLKFPPNLGAPASIQMPNLVSWTENSDPGVKYFSGTAQYSTVFTTPGSSTAAGS